MPSELPAATPLPKLKRLLLRLLRIYPPYLGARIRVRRLPSGGFESSLRLVWWNRNFVGTHFGGSLYAMTDPFYVLLLYEALGADYVVWIRGADIDFVKPGRGTVSARFELDRERVAAIRAALDRDERVEPRFQVTVVDGADETVATVDQRLYVRRGTHKI
ncbi:MAG: DUF4442 domain-containing protein [Thermoanaerobaculia bacterium]